jgi:hypothetical protein
MSHYFLGVIIPPDTPIEGVEAAITKLLARYDERVEIDPYKLRLSGAQVEEMASFYGFDPKDLAACGAHLEDWTSLEGGVDEEGLYMWTTYNPEARWDWYTIGGRWCGVICGALCTGEGKEPHSHLRHNVSRVRELSPEVQFFALCTPQGEWYERGRMGWFGMVANEMEEKRWRAVRSEVLSSYPEHLIVGVDCHI